MRMLNDCWCKVQRLDQGIFVQLSILELEADIIVVLSIFTRTPIRDVINQHGLSCFEILSFHMKLWENQFFEMRTLLLNFKGS